MPADAIGCPFSQTSNCSPPPIPTVNRTGCLARTVRVRQATAPPDPARNLTTLPSVNSFCGLQSARPSLEFGIRVNAIGRPDMGFRVGRRQRRCYQPGAELDRRPSGRLLGEPRRVSLASRQERLLEVFFAPIQRPFGIRRGLAADISRIKIVASVTDRLEMFMARASLVGLQLRIVREITCQLAPWRYRRYSVISRSRTDLHSLPCTYLQD